MNGRFMFATGLLCTGGFLACGAENEIDANGEASTTGPSMFSTSAVTSGSGGGLPSTTGSGGSGAGTPTSTGSASGGGGGSPLDCTGPSGWTALGGSLDAVGGATDAASPSLVIGEDNEPIVAWSEGDPLDVHVVRFDGTDWVDLGGPLSNSPGDTFATQPFLAVDASGASLHVAWSEWDGSATHPVVKRWDGSTWQDVGAPLGDGPMFSFNSSLRLDSMGRPVLAWNESDGNATNVRVARWSGSAWVDLGGMLSSVGGGSSAIAPYLAFDGVEPTVAWQESSDIYIREYDGQNWNTINTADLDQGFSEFAVHIAYRSGGRLVAAFAAAGGEATDSIVRERGSGPWSSVGGTINAVAGNGTNAVVDGFALDGTGAAIVAWSERGTDGTEDVHVAREEGSAFAPLGGGLLDAESGDTAALQPDLAIDACGRVVVAWVEETPSGRRVYVERYAEP